MDMNELQRLIKEIESQMKTCMRCGMCQAVCPLFLETYYEADSARGKLALLDGLIKGLFEDSDGVEKRLKNCLFCGSCAAYCPSEVHILEIFIKARAILASYKGLGLLKKIIFRKTLANPLFFNHVFNLISKLQGVFAKPADNICNTKELRFAWPVGRRHFRSLPDASFSSTQGPKDFIISGSGLKAGFFTGCIIDKLYPSLGLAVLNVLSFHGISVFVPKVQACCGMPALSEGDSQSFNKLLHYTLNMFDPMKLDYIITACPTCTLVIKRFMPLMASGLSKEEAKRLLAFSNKVMDINQFLVEKTGINKKRYKQGHDIKTVTFHDPCHLKKSFSISNEPRELIRANPYYNLREMHDPDLCCGFGGSFNIRNYELSCMIGNKKLKSILDTGADIVATSCPACILQLTDMLSKAGKSIKVMHSVEIYSKNL